MLALSTSASADEGASAPAAGCYPDWSTAIPVVQSEVLTPARDLHAQIRARQLGDLVRITLCEEAGRHVYRLLVMDPSGHISPMIVDARHPF